MTQAFKSEMRTIEDLTEKIVNSGILPKPEVEILDYCWDWKEFAVDNLCREELRNHASYHAFNLKKEDGSVKLRGKRYLYEEEWVPSTGIRLLREGTQFNAIGPADFRVEKLQLDKVFQHLQRFLATLPLTEKMTVRNSWDRLRDKIEKIPTQKEMLKQMKLLELPSQTQNNHGSLPTHFAHLEQDEAVPDLLGEIFPETLEEADFTEEVRVGLDVLIYCKTKKGRPWCGRIVQILENHQFMIQWYDKQKGNIFIASFNSDGTPYTTKLDNGTVILWNFSSRVDDSSFHVNSFFLSKFKEEYCKHDCSNISV